MLFCSKCGNKIESADEKFCSVCGEPNSAYTAAPTAEPAPLPAPIVPTAPPVVFCPGCGGKFEESDIMFCPNCGTSRGGEQLSPAPGKKTRSPKILAVAAVIAAIFVGGAIFVFTSPAMTTLRVMSNFSDDVVRRIETTPFHAVPLLWGILDNGTAEIDFRYRQDAGWMNVDVRGDLTYMSNRNRTNYMLAGNVSAMGMRFDLEMFLDSNRLAARSDLLGRDFYGITFRTFRDDIRSFGDLINLDNRTMDAMADFVEIFAESMTMDAEDAWAPYRRFLTRFVRSLDFSRGGGGRIDITLTDEDIIRFMHEYLDLLEDDELSQDMFSAMDRMGLDLGFSQMIRELRRDIDRIEREMDGDVEIVVSIFTSRGRMERLEINALYESRHNDGSIFFELDFGSSRTDNWRGELIVRESGWDTESANFFWDISERRDNYIHTFGFRNNWDSQEFSVEWNQNRGDFTLLIPGMNNLHGSFTTARNSMELTFDDVQIGRNQYLSIGISAERGTNIPSIDFINLDRWDRSLMDALENLTRMF